MFEVVNSSNRIIINLSNEKKMTWSIFILIIEIGGTKRSGKIDEWIKEPSSKDLKFGKLKICS